MDSIREGHLGGLPAQVCWALLETVPAGRLVVVIAGVPDIVRVDHLVDHESLLVRTGEGMKIAAAAGHPMAYEVDSCDPVSGRGWSVVVTGHVQLLAARSKAWEALRASGLWNSDVNPSSVVRFESDGISGRRFAMPWRRVG